MKSSDYDGYDISSDLSEAKPGRCPSCHEAELERVGDGWGCPRCPWWMSGEDREETIQTHGDLRDRYLLIIRALCCECAKTEDSPHLQPPPWPCRTMEEYAERQACIARARLKAQELLHARESESLAKELDARD